MARTALPCLSISTANDNSKKRTSVSATRKNGRPFSSSDKKFQKFWNFQSKTPKSPPRWRVSLTGRESVREPTKPWSLVGKRAKTTWPTSPTGKGNLKPHPKNHHSRPPRCFFTIKRTEYSLTRLSVSQFTLKRWLGTVLTKKKTARKNDKNVALVTGT